MGSGEPVLIQETEDSKILELCRSLAEAAKAQSIQPSYSTQVIEPVAKHLLASDIVQLKLNLAKQVEVGFKRPKEPLCERGLEIYLARKHEIPNLIHEIGRLRELTYRREGEGSGQALDLDAFDEHYVHLFAWEPETQRLVGAYRLGLVDQLLLGSKTLENIYSYQFFRYAPAFFEQAAAMVEFGRTFVVTESQKDAMAFPMIWKGIARFFIDNPRYYVLFGGVSISNAYNPLSKLLMMSYLQKLSQDHHQVGNIHPASPCVEKSLFSAADIEQILTWIMRKTERNKTQQDLNSLVAAIEADGKSMPSLIRSYLGLGSQIIGFNLDRDFNSIDGAVYLDLRQVNIGKAATYFGGKEALHAYLAANKLLWQDQVQGVPAESALATSP